MKESSIYQQLGGLLAKAPDLRAVDDRHQIPESTIQWLGKVSALVEAMPGASLNGTQLDLAIQSLIRYQGVGQHPSQIMMILSRVLSKAELNSPVSQQGAFVSGGDGFDALAAISKILSSASNSVLIVDPYLDDKALSDFVVLANEGVVVSLLTDQSTIKPSLVPACVRWISQFGNLRPLQARAATARSLHDRLIFVDSDQAWILTQSLKDFAARSPATIQRADDVITKLKFEAYKEIWNVSSSIVP